MKWYLNKSLYSTLIAVVLFVKIVIYLALQTEELSVSFGGGNDAEYYHAYALGYTDAAVNFWPVILRFFYEQNLYSRESWSFLLFVVSLSLLPFFFYQLVKDKHFNIAPVAQVSFLVVLFYPTIFFFSMDLYRDVFMFAVLLLALFIYKSSFEKSFLTASLPMFVFLALCYFLFLLRPYLGASLALSVVVYLFYNRFADKVKTMNFLYIVFIMLMKFTGILNPVLEYRGADGFTEGGASLGIGLLDANPVSFVFLYVYSFFAQVFGFFFVNGSSVFVFLFESLPFIFALIYVFKNIRFATNFVKYLIVFFVIYTTIWVMGNDNLGTAVRLRVPSYLAVFACMLIIYQEKVKYLYFQAQQGQP